ncbi:uncharacterized protein LOC122399068 isoform X1 [Colletes gigas]|uniref:uncharacterized protein LOC122399068 isoform X1 n=1 Tax=Colletes gigas TaxID=935657 RepID=UPI001C9A590A|nr:uncharacterized protein LOC122399068 isoform X1 [Colletes gigas]XP_043255374.1 uncharacterized protein LOC122399068 isoform X1 [Colletes gigas]XP_043255375.1 uncharacterized protein LOC122399068 isoform X1 [Colletes gigas]XP_043255376.1 uncharacterized protein LOC122399068 isoform X1 [Colletes gigas]
MSYVEEGTKARKTASTSQNPNSSRSHALLTIAVSPETPSIAANAVYSSKKKPRKPRGGSKLSLVDLAGSESAATCSGVHRLKEGANINKSLVALGNVISALAERGSAGSGPGRRFIPYRDSSLTWLLKDALGGNATTIMLATISPASRSYNETAHTLRFAQRAQSVVNRPVVNEDPVARVIRELRTEVARLKLLMLEKNTEANSNASCSCRKNHSIAQIDALEDERSTKETETISYGQSKQRIVDSRFEERPSERNVDEEWSSSSVVPVRRSNSTEDIVACEAAFSLKRFGSCEFLAARDRFASNYNRAKVTELNDEGDEIGEIHESVFVDIPTLVAVLIKPDDSLQDSSAQIEEICSDEAVEDSIDGEFIETSNDRGAFEDPDKSESPVKSCRETYVYQASEFSHLKSVSNLKEKRKFCKQDSVDIVSSNLQTSKKFGSVEIIQKKKEPLFPLERSHTNLEKRSIAPDRVKKLNNIREIDDRNNSRNVWKGSKEQLQRKSSNDSDKSLKEAVGQVEAKSKNYARKTSLENLKRKTSKDSSSSSSKDEQILISSFTRDKLLQRKNSLEQELPSTRAHTPIQRAKRSEIVAAVTQRLYASRKAAEDASGVRTPPEGTDAKFVAKMKLQEISKKMLGKRRRVCVDTQTDVSPTVRTKDTASLTETPLVVHQDVGVLTDDHEACQSFDNKKTPVLRVKEIATLTDKPKTSIVRCRDVGSLANDLEDREYEIYSPRNDSEILSDKRQNYAESNLSELRQETDRKPMRIETSTNTIRSSCRSFAVQTPSSPPPPRLDASNTKSEALVCSRQCCNPDKSVISISLPDTISITIETTNVLESRIALMDSPDREKFKSDSKDGEVQTDEPSDLRNEIFCPRDLARSALGQTDRVFRIENIFQDPNNVSKGSKADVAANRTEGTRMRNSITLRNSLGTSYVSQCTEAGDDGSMPRGRHGEGFIRDGLITEAFITKKRSFNFRKVPGVAVYDDPWTSWLTPRPVNKIRSIQVMPAVGLSLSGFENDAINDTGTSEIKTSPCTVLETSNNAEHDHSFSDDSLDYNESNAFNQPTPSKEKQEDSHELRESLCPPDVVAHTKKDSSRSSSTADVENIESVGDIDSNLHVKLPKKNQSESMEVTQIHDYESSMLTRPCFDYRTVDQESLASSNRVNSSDKKKVSFSSFSVPGKRLVQAEDCSNQESQIILKSIIKKRKKRNSPESSSTVQSSNDETDDSQQEERSSLASEKNWKEQIPSSNLEKTLKEGLGSEDFRNESKQNRKKVKFSVENTSENTCSSESESCENTEDDVANVSFDGATRNILEEYLSEATAYIRNLNSINEYVNVAAMLERYTAPMPADRSKKRGPRRRSYSTARNRDYVEFVGRRGSLKNDTDIFSKETDDVAISTESYEKCLKGIQRLEGCIRRVDRHNELLREKYGVDWESAGAKLGLANPSIDTRTPTASNEFLISRETDVPFVSKDLAGSRLVDLSDGGLGDENDIFENRIFHRSMNAANSTHYPSFGKLPNRFFQLSDLRSQSSVGCSEFLEKHDRATKVPFSGDVHGSFDLDESSRDNDEPQDFTRYEITGNLSVESAVASTRGNVDDDLDSIEEDYLPLRTFDRASWLAKPTKTSGCDNSLNSFSKRSLKIDSGIVDSYSMKRPTLKTNFPVQRDWIDGTRERWHELDDYSRKFRDCDSKVRACSNDQSNVESSINEIMYFRDKLKQPGSPRARFLELLRERRRIVESSRGTSVS